MEIILAIAIVIGFMGIALLSLGQSIKSAAEKLPAPEDHGTEREDLANGEGDAQVECWNCPSCSQWNRVDQPFYLYDKHLCQNCYEPKPERVEFQSMTMATYWSQAKFAQEHFRRQAEKAKERPWINPSIAQSKTYRIDFDAPEKKMPDDLKDKISRN